MTHPLSKDPLAAVLSAVEFVGPCRFGGYALDAKTAVKYGVAVGDPYAKQQARAWVQIAAVSKDQTRNTMTLMPSLFSDDCIADHRIDMGKEIIYAEHGARRIEAVTSSPKALEGGRPTFIIRNETHHWHLNNEGHAMHRVIRRNLAKIKGGQARGLSITNAYEPSEDSVAQIQREAWEKQKAGLAIDTGVMYDSLEAPPNAFLRLPKNPDTGVEPTEAETRAYITAVLEAVRGDAIWLDTERILDEIFDPQNAPSQSRRFYYNQVVADEDAWADPGAIEAAMDVIMREFRQDPDSAKTYDLGWKLVDPREPVVMFFDGSKSDDSTVLVGSTLESGYVFTIGTWNKPAGERGEGWVVPRHEVDNRVQDVFDRLNVVAFWGDPSHAKDDEAQRYWDGLVDDWHRRFKDRLDPKFWAIKTGPNQHSIMWDMASPERSAAFTAAAELYIEELEHKSPNGDYEPLFKHDGDPVLVHHMKNARRFPTKFGISLWKGHRESARKVDAAVGAVGARLLRRVVLNVGRDEEKPKGSKVWGV